MVVGTPVLIVTGRGMGNHPSDQVILYNNTGGVVYLGGSTVDNNGMPLAGGATLSISMMMGETIYGYISSGSGHVHVLRSGNA